MSKFLSKRIIVLGCVSLLASSLAFAGDYKKGDKMEGHDKYHDKAQKVEKYSKNLVSIAASKEDFSTLVAAVKAAGLVETLQGDGPFTVFAPTNEAFAKLPKGTLEELLKPENKEKLRAILTYHVVPGKVYAKDVVAIDEAKTVQGNKVAIKTKGKKVMVDNAKVINTDIAASNGVIHVIDTVILPAS